MVEFALLFCMEHGAWSRGLKAQGARPKVEEIDSSCFRYALGATWPEPVEGCGNRWELTKSKGRAQKGPASNSADFIG